MEGEISNDQWVLTSYPKGPVTEGCFTKRPCPRPTPGNGQVLLRTLYISVDPYLRIKMYPKEGGVGEFAPFKLEEPLESFLLGEVLESSAPGVVAGDLVVCVGPWQRYVVVEARQCDKVPSEFSPSTYLNVVGLIGLSTYFPVVEIGQPKAGETVFVSGAAGAVGSLACQLFKAFGCRVIGCTSTDNKVEALKSLVDAVLNYKTNPVEAALAQLAPEGIDIYWDNVGGEVLDTVLLQMRRGGRVIACGNISQYHNLEEAYGVRNLFTVVGKCLTIQGFLASDYMNRKAECYSKLGSLLRQGKIRPLETVMEGFESLPRAFIGLFEGANLGKMLVKVNESQSSIAQSSSSGVKVPVESVEGEGEGKRGRLEEEIRRTRELLVMSEGRAKRALEMVLLDLEKEVMRVSAPVEAAPIGQVMTAATPLKSDHCMALAHGGGGGGGKPSHHTSLSYTTVDSFGWDQGEYNSPWVTVYVRLEGVGQVKDQVDCDFTVQSFDLKVHGLDGKNYRLLKENLDKEIVPEESKVVVKKDQIKVQLRKKKGEYGFDHWADLTAKRRKEAGAKEDPLGGVMDLMKDMYESGDDNMRRVIGEAMMKASRGERSPPGPGFSSSTEEFSA